LQGWRGPESNWGHHLAAPANQARRSLTRQTADRDRLDPRSLEGPLLILAGRAQERHAVGLEPPHREQQGVLRRAIDPLRVVDDDQQRVRLRRGGEQSKGGGAD
jgi:hypothetical protein